MVSSYQIKEMKLGNLEVRIDHGDLIGTDLWPFPQNLNLIVLFR